MGKRVLRVSLDGDAPDTLRGLSLTYEYVILGVPEGSLLPLHSLPFFWWGTFSHSVRALLSSKWRGDLLDPEL